jgi:hypothetical protein
VSDNAKPTTTEPSTSRSTEPEHKPTLLDRLKSMPECTMVEGGPSLVIGGFPSMLPEPKRHR